MTPSDIDAVASIAASVHPGLPERRAVFAGRLALFPAGCMMLADIENACGYAIAHPWRGGAPSLDTLLPALPDRPDHLYVHDVALLDAARGAGHGVAALKLIERLAADTELAMMRLVSLPGSLRFWRAAGFDVEGPAPASYGRGAVRMMKGPKR